jgi:protease-4
VLAFKPDVSALANKVGIRSQTIQKGDHADLFSPWRGWDQGELKRIEANVRHDYEMFIETVAVSRQRPKSEIESLAGGRVYSGETALKLGLIHRLGGFFEALEEAKKAIGLDPKDRVSLVVFPKEKGLLEALASRPLGYQDPYSQLAQNLGCMESIVGMLQGSQTAVLWPILVRLD